MGVQGIMCAVVCLECCSLEFVGHKSSCYQLFLPLQLLSPVYFSILSTLNSILKSVLSILNSVLSILNSVLSILNSVLSILNSILV